MKETGSKHYYGNNTLINLANIHPSFLISFLLLFYVFNPNLQIKSKIHSFFGVCFLLCGIYWAIELLIFLRLLCSIIP